MKLPAEITITEQITGEGFAAETNFIPTEAKAWIIREMINAGSKSIQVSNFGNPKMMPQFRDCDELYRQLGQPEGVTFQAPTNNKRALDRVIELRKSGCGPQVVEFLIATTDAFNMSNLGAPRIITDVDVGNLRACELIHRYGFYSTSEDGRTVMGVLKYEQLWETRRAQEYSEDKSEPRKCRMCGHALTVEIEDKIGRPKEYCHECESFRNKERKRKSRYKHKSTTTRQLST